VATANNALATVSLNMEYTLLANGSTRQWLDAVQAAGTVRSYPADACCASTGAVRTISCSA
jgi:hypothetical protein